MNIILVSDSLARSRSVALSQAQVVLIAFGILIAGFMLAMATYVVTMKFAVDLRNPYLRTLLAALHQDDLKRSEAEMRDNMSALAVKVGDHDARRLYSGAIMLPLLFSLVIAFEQPWVLLTLILALPVLILAFGMRLRVGPSLGPMFLGTSAVGFFYGVLLAVGIAL